MRQALLFLVAGAAAACSGSDGAERRPDAGPEPLADSVSFADAIVAATHNSYESPDGFSIPGQLDFGIRFVELDLWNEGYATEGFRVGHEEPGEAVVHGDGNPDGDDLGDWLAVIGGWSRAHPEHAPITVLFDMKNNLAGAEPGAGDLEDLDALAQEAFGELLLAPDEVGGTWPTIGELRGRIVPVLSGSETSRLAYATRGSTPVFFVEAQRLDELDWGDVDPWFSSAGAGMSEDAEWATAERARGRLARLWKVNFEVFWEEVNYPATDLPNAPWYRDACLAAGCVQ